MSHPRSVPVKRRLIAMMEARFPNFPFSYEWQNTYGFVRRREGRLYDYLLIGRGFEEYQAGWRGYLGVGPPGRGYNPDWYSWTTGDPWQRSLWNAANYEEILYQQDRTAFLDDALEQLAEKIQREILPLYETIFPRIPSSELRRWQTLAERILPRLETLAQADPDRWEALRRWQKDAAWGRADMENPPEEMARWYREIRELPGFREIWDRSPITREHVFNWFTHTMLVHP